MKVLILTFTILLLASCTEDKSSVKKADRLYFISNCGHDTNFIDFLSFDTTNLTIITTRTFMGDIDDNFSGQVVKLTNEPAPIDGGTVHYLTPDLGIIYFKSTTWPCYSRLHSTNDSIENRINEYLEHILLWPDLAVKGELPPRQN